MKHSRIVAAVFAGALAVVVAATSHAQVSAGAVVDWGPWYGPFAPNRYGLSGYGWIVPWGPCGAGGCIDDPYLRRAIRRELEQLEYHRELEERARRGLAPDGSPYGARRDGLAPTPEAQVQPAYRGSGEIRPEFSRVGEPRQSFAEPPR